MPKLVAWKAATGSFLFLTLTKKYYISFCFVGLLFIFYGLGDLLGTSLLGLCGLLGLSLRDRNGGNYLRLIIILILLLCRSRNRSLLGENSSNCRLLLVILLQLVEAISGSRRLLLSTSRIRTVIRRTIIYEAKATETLGERLNRDLLGLPARAKLGTSNPDTSAADDGTDAAATDEKLLNRDTLITTRCTLAIQSVGIIELSHEDTILLLEGDLRRRRIGLRLALLVNRNLDHRRVERTDDLTASIRKLEPGLGVGHCKLNQTLVKRLGELVEGLDLRISLSITEGQINAVLRSLAVLVKDIHAVRELRHRSLNHPEAAAVELKVHSLTTIVQYLERLRRQLRGIKITRENCNGRHISRQLCLNYPEKRAVKFF